MSYADLFKGLVVGIIIGALLAAAVGYFWFYQGDTASTQHQGDNTQPSGLEDSPQFSAKRRRGRRRRGIEDAGTGSGVIL